MQRYNKNMRPGHPSLYFSFYFGLWLSPVCVWPWQRCGAPCAALWHGLHGPLVCGVGAGGGVLRVESARASSRNSVYFELKQRVLRVESGSASSRSMTPPLSSRPALPVPGHWPEAVEALWAAAGGDVKKEWWSIRNFVGYIWLVKNYFVILHAELGMLCPNEYQKDF